jgi:hypothetical protein
MYNTMRSQWACLVGLILLGLFPGAAEARALPGPHALVYRISETPADDAILHVPDGAWHLRIQLVQRRAPAASIDRPAQQMGYVIAQVEGIGNINESLHLHGPWLDALNMNCELVVQARPLSMMPGWRTNLLLPDIRRIWLGPSIPKHMQRPDGGIVMPNDGHGFDGITTGPPDDDGV